MPSVKIAPEQNIDPALLFQRFVVRSVKNRRAFDARGHELQAQSVSPFQAFLRPVINKMMQTRDNRIKGQETT